MEKINKQKDIKIIEDQVSAVRQLPDVYIGALGNRGYLNMFREILQNSLDEIIKGNTLDKNIIVSFDERNYLAIIEDNGQGIKLDMLVPVFSILHSSSNYDKVEGSGDYSSGKNGMGATITNFLSRIFTVESYRMDGTAATASFEEGRLKKNGYKIIDNPSHKHGLKTIFAPSEMMGNITVTEQEIEQLIWQLCHLCSIGTKIIFNSINKLNRKRTVVIENKNGIAEILMGICDTPIFKPVHFAYDNGTMKIEVLFTYDTSKIDDPIIVGFANMCPTVGGTHIDGYLDANIKYFKDYMNKIFLANNKKLNVVASDIRTGLRAVVSCFHIKPLFTGQSKEIFSSEDMKSFAYNKSIEAINEWFKNNSLDLQKLSKYFKQVAEIRIKSDGEKIKMSDKYTPSVISGYPSKYKKPNSNKSFELWITEGDSAASGMENNRDKSCQGIMPIRGKIINAFTTPVKKYFENQEVAGLFKIFGYNGYSKKFDPDKFRPEKVVIATDADPDGKHIECLLFGMFLRYLPFVIEQGKLYTANPPLYGMPIGKNKMKFFADDLEYIEYIQNLFCKENDIQAYNNNVSYSKKDITKIIYRNQEYLKLMNHICNLYAFDPYFLEFVLYNINLPYNKFKKTIQSNYQYITVSQENGIILLRGLVGSAYQTMFVNDRLIIDCSELLNIINKSDRYYTVNGNITTLYGLMSLFNKFEPKNLTRYKGLGEMPPKLLGSSTVIPGQGRVLKQYTIEDAKKELELITEMQSDKSVFLNNIKVKKEDIV